MAKLVTLAKKKKKIEKKEMGTKGANGRAKWPNLAKNNGSI